MTKFNSSIVLLLVSVLCCASPIHAQIDRSSLSKFSMNVEAGMLPIKSTGTTSVNSLAGQLGINYNFWHFIMLGVYGRTIFYHGSTDVTSVDDKIIDLSSIEYNTIGASLGLRFRKYGIEIMPKLDVGYDLLVGRATDFPTNNKAFIDFRYWSLNPKLYIGYAFTPFMTIGANVGYHSQVSEIKGHKIAEFNPNAVNGAVFCSFFFRSGDYLPKKGKDSVGKYDNRDLMIPYFKK